MPVIKIENCLNCEIPHEWIFNGARLKELRTIKQLTGMNAKEFAGAGDDLNPEAIAALIYILHMRDKIKVPFDDIDLDFSDFSMEPTVDEAEEMEKIELEKRMQSANDEAQAPKVS